MHPTRVLWLLVLSFVSFGWLGCGPSEDNDWRSTVEKPSLCDSGCAGAAGNTAAQPDAQAAEATADAHQQKEAGKADAGSAEASTSPDAGSNPGSDAAQPGWVITRFQVTPAEIQQGGSVEIQVDIVGTGVPSVADAKLLVPSQAPNGQTFDGETAIAELKAGETTTLKQTRGPYKMVGTWSYHVSVVDSKGNVLAQGPADGATMKVVEAPIVKVLIYNGTYAGTYGVAGTKDALASSNQKGWIPGVQFEVGTSTSVKASTLSSYDVLVMPGGDGGYNYTHHSAIDGAAIRDFVSSGHGYVGTCAGAYSAAGTTVNYDDGTWNDYGNWGVAPNVTAHAVSFEGQLMVQLTAQGTTLFDLTGTIELHHWNGAAMKAKAPAVVLAAYADNNTGHKGLGAIVADTYGSGRAILSGPHPELESPYRPEMVARMVAWAANRINYE